MDKEPLDLLRAVRKYGIYFKAWSEYKYEETSIILKNGTQYEFRIDISRSGLISKNGKSQRIGLCYPKRSGPGDYIIDLKSGQEKDIVLNSRCLDKRGEPPENGTEYVLIPELFSDYVVDLLRKGSDQKEVWATIDERGKVLRVRLPIPAMVDKL